MTIPRPPRKNPFPVDRFIGGDAVVADVLSHVASGESAAILGEPRVGKTALLRHLAGSAVLAAEPDLLVAHVDAHALDAPFDRTRFWTAALGPLEAAGRLGPADTPLASAYREAREGGLTKEGVEGFLTRLGESGRRLVVLVDEFDYLVRRNIAEQGDFFTGLRSLMTGTHRALSVIAASREHLEHLEALWREKGVGGSPPFNTFRLIDLGALDEDDVDAVLLHAEADFSPEDRGFVHHVSGGYPYFVQTAAWALFRERAADPAQRRRDAGLALLDEASRSLEDIWSRWPSSTQYVFAAVAVEHLDALGARIGWEPGAGLLADPETFPRELRVLTLHGFLAASPHTPSGYVVRPLVFLAWFAVKLRRHAQSAEEWSAWMEAEGWRKAWHLGAAIRVRAAAVRTGLERLLLAHAALLAEQRTPPRPSPAPRPSPLPESLVLHLSDLHFGTLANAELWYGQLAQDLRDLGCRRLDAVILSGDVANVSAAAEYEAAKLFLDKLRAGFQLSPAQVIPVPGNHDLNWGLAKKAYKLVDRDEHAGGLEEGRFIDVGGSAVRVRDEALYPGRFEPFAAFYQAVRGEPYPLDPADQALLYPLHAPRILVLGLNSAWELDHHFRTRAGIHPIALSRAIERVHADPAHAGFLKIAVWHHPVQSAFEDRIKDHGFLERLAAADFRLALHGHIHKADTGLYRYDRSAGGRRIEIVCAGTFGAPVREWVPGYPLQYQLLRFQGEGVTVETRRREELHGAWSPDARWTSAKGRSPEPRYTVRLVP
jgi:3',5'-cyclic AMP phosphodiesterase CpdA